MYSMISSVHHDLRESIPMHMHMTILLRIYTYIHVYIYLYKYIHPHTYTYIHVQRRCPRHQLYEVLGMSADRVLLTIKCMKSAAYPFSPAYAPQPDP